MPAIWIMKHFRFLSWIPEGLIVRLNPHFQSLLHIRGTLGRQIDMYMSDEKHLAECDRKTIYHHLLAADTDFKGQRSLSRTDLIHEAITLLAAGSDTVGNTCTIGTFYALSDPKVIRRLQEELFEVWPDKDAPMKLATLEKLPYLVNCNIHNQSCQTQFSERRLSSKSRLELAPGLSHHFRELWVLDRLVLGA